MFRIKNILARGFTLVEVMIVVAIVALLALLAIPSIHRARQRSQAARVIADLRLIDAAKDQYAIDYDKKGSYPITWSQVQLYLKSTTSLYESAGKDLFGHEYPLGNVDGSTHAHPDTYAAFSTLNLPDDFWGRFKP